jgi:hypothetical protein
MAIDFFKGVKVVNHRSNPKALLAGEQDRS